MMLVSDRVRRRGLSLAEAIVSIFLLVGAFVTLISLFHSGLRYSSEALGRETAVLIAENKLEEIRDWAATATGGGYNFDDWTTYQNVTTTDADFPDYKVRVQALPYAVDSPSSSFEAPYAAVNNARRLRTSLQKVRVTVSWKQGSKSLSLVTMVGDPIRQPRAANPVVLTPVGSPPPALARDASQQYAVYGYDVNNNVIRDLGFDWVVKPGRANATLAQSRDGSSVNATNVIQLPSQPPAYTGGNLTILARTVYRGLAISGETAPLPLTP